EVHLEEALQRAAAGDVAARGLQAVVVRELDEGALAIDGGVGADLAAAEGGEDLALLVGEAVVRPELLVPARNVLLERELGVVLREAGMARRFGAGGEDERLRVAAEE